MAMLEMKQITKTFFGKAANNKVDFSVEKGEIHALLGENGAGKTTLMNILYGLYQADSGEVIWKGEKISFASPKDAIASNIGMVHQHFSLVKKMTVLDNIILGLKQSGVFLPRKEAKKSIIQLADKYGLKVDPDAVVQSLSVGEQQRVEILKALYRDVELLILDEPTGVLTPKETEHFFGVLRKLKNEGYGIIIITHRMSEIMEISDRVTILRDGRCVKSLVTGQTNPEELSQHMIGRKLKEEEANEYNPGKETLVLDQVYLQKGRKKPLLENISLKLYEGEILGIAGVDGNGQKELAEVIAGIRRHTSGKVIFEGEDLEKASVRKRFEAGISYISDDRQRDGLVGDMSVRDNMMLKNYKSAPFSKYHIFNRSETREKTREAIREYKIKTPGTEIPAKVLSGGNQQKIILSREISESARCIIASQPARGLDLGAAEFVRDMLKSQRDAGKSVLLISADLEEIMALCDRIAVMFSGGIAGILSREEADIRKIGLLMGGMKEEAAQ